MMTLRGSIPLLGVAKRLHFRATSRGANPFFLILLFSRVLHTQNLNNGVSPQTPNYI